MESKHIIPEGIVRNTPNEASSDSSLLEAVNVRYKDGAWRQVGNKVAETNYINIAENSVIYYHPSSSKYICLVFRVDTWMVEAHTPGSTGGTYDSLFEIATVTNAAISHVGNFVYITSTTIPNSFVLFWNATTNSYFELNYIPELNISIHPTYTDNYSEGRGKCFAEITGLSTDDFKYNAVIGKFSKLIEDKRKSGLFHGHVSIKYAIKLYDGSYIMHSIPIYVHGGAFSSSIDYASGTLLRIAPRTGLTGAPDEGVEYWVVYQFIETDYGWDYITFYGIEITIDLTSALSILQSYFDCKLIQSICFFSTSIAEGYIIPNGYSELPSPNDNSSERYLPNDINYSKGIYDPPSMFLIKEVLLKDILTGSNTYTIDTFMNIETNESISPDNFTHHTLIGNNLYTINNKIHSSNIITKPSFPLTNSVRHNLFLNSELVASQDRLKIYDIPSSKPSGFKYYSEVSLLTQDGLKKCTSEITSDFYSCLYNGDVALRMNAIYTYPDIRAVSVLFWVLKESNLTSKKIFEIQLTPSIYSDYSYYVRGYAADEWSSNAPLQCFSLVVPKNNDQFSALESYPSTIYSDLIRDYNRVQVSKLNNPFVWDAKNSYRFGNEHNTVLALTTAQEPLTETVFGMYPVIVFTEQGMYTLERGTGDVMYSNVAELNKEILSNVKGIVGITGAVIFVTKSGLKVLEGRQVSDMSIQVRGNEINPVSGDAFFNASDELDNEILSLTPETFISYTQGAILGFSHVFNEVVISKPSSDLSYVYNLETKSWHSVSGSYSQFLVNRAYNAGHLYDLNTESGYPVYFMQSRPLMLGLDSYKKINQMLVRSKRNVKPNQYDQIIVFGSNDAKTWICIAKILITNDTTSHSMRNMPGHYRYISYIIIGKGESFSLTGIDVLYTPAYINKLR